MKYAIKKQNSLVLAYQLGKGTAMEDYLLQQGRIRRLNPQKYEIFSREAVHGAGEQARAGDYIKLDIESYEYYPYPNRKEWFEKNHVHVYANSYREIRRPLLIWEDGDPLTPEIEFLLKQKKLKLKQHDDQQYFNARLWNTRLSASRDAVLILYKVIRNLENEIQDIQFNFIAREEFDRKYRYCSVDTN